MRTLFNAPVTSPLSEVDTSNVAELFVELTRASVLVQPSPAEEASVHESLVLRVCNEILRDVFAPEVRLYCKTLSWLEINTDPGSANTELKLLLKEILQEVKDKNCRKVIEKLYNQINGNDSSKSASNQEASVLNFDDNNGAEAMTKDETKPKRPKRGQKKASTAKNGRKTNKEELSSDGSDEENIPEERPSQRPSRRTKMIALDKTRQDLTAFMNQEANSS